jgi:hypothetical protein
MLNPREILQSGTPNQIYALFSFDVNTSVEKVVLKFNLWGRYFFSKYYSSADASFHHEIDLYNARVYRGDIDAFLNICFRGAAKTTRTKLFLAFCILNDSEHSKRYIKILSRDGKNSTQFTTDIYNMMVQPRVNALYPEIFAKTLAKREETMSSFTTATGVKLASGTVGSSQRGQIQDESRPDLIIFDDFEDRITLRSAVLTQSVWDNMEEARTGLSKDGGTIYLCNYLSERGNVHKLVQKVQKQLIVPIIKDGIPAWDRYTTGDIATIKANADDFEGEYLCEPSAGADIFFDREILKRQVTKEPVREIGGFKIFYPYNPSHRYGGAADIGGGVGLDHSTSAFIDFSTVPNRVVATFKSNTIKPDVFGHELIREADMYGQPILAPENNKFDMCIGVLKHQNYPNIYFTEIKEVRAGMPPTTRTYGWNTNAMTKPKMLFELKSAVEDGLLELTDEDAKRELMSYTRDDLMDRDDDVRLTTRHFDLLIAIAIAWQMRNFAAVKREIDGGYQQPEYERTGLGE